MKDTDGERVVCLRRNKIETENYGWLVYIKKFIMNKTYIIRELLLVNKYRSFIVVKVKSN